MGAELGATTSVFAYDERMAAYLRATEREELAALAEANRDLLTADAEVLTEPERYFEQVIEIDLSELEPHVVGPHRPDLARPISELAGAAADEGYPEQISAALVGSCTNSSYEDISRAADLARQAAARGAKARVPFLVTPGSEMVRATIERDGQLAGPGVDRGGGAGERLRSVYWAVAARRHHAGARGRPAEAQLDRVVVQPEFPKAE